MLFRSRYDLKTNVWDFFLYPLEKTEAEDDWIGLSEIVSLGSDRYAVIERDKMVGGAIKLKAVYTFSLQGVKPYNGIVTPNADLQGRVIRKARALDLAGTFAPFEKLEGLTVTPNGRVWAALDNDGGEVTDRKSTRLNSSHIQKSRMPSSA